MSYTEIQNIVKNGKIGILPKFVGYFKWNYNENYMEFYNGDFTCPADMLEIKNREDFYYIT